MSLIAIDPGLKTSNTGVAVFQSDLLVYSGVFIVQNVPWRENMNALVHYLRAFIKKNDLVVVETSFYQGKANIMHLKTLGVLDYFFDIETIAPLSVKKLLTGVGRTPKIPGEKPKVRKTKEKQRIKNAVIKVLSEKEGKILKRDAEDAVDAVAIGLAYMTKMLGEKDVKKK